MQDRGSQVVERRNHYLVKAYAPPHEKDEVRISVQNNRAVISGQRKFSDVSQDENKKIQTNNFQSFREEFKFDLPVSHEGMTRERDGDYIVFTIPKMESFRTDLDDV